MAATAEQLGAVHAALERLWAAMDSALTASPDTSWRLRFATGVAEIAANIVRHAYPGGDAPGLMVMRLRVYRDRVEACFTDNGIAFVQPRRRPRPRGDQVLTIPEGGRGLELAHAVVDRLDYERMPDGQNCWRLVKCL